VFLHHMFVMGSLRSNCDHAMRAVKEPDSDR
jgi:hypothetical protein